MNRRVDEKLYSAESVLAADAADAAVETALAEAALFHLHVAYRAYLREILDHFQLEATADSAQHAAQLLRARNRRSADVDELAELERSGGWPAQLLVAYAAAAGIDAAPVPAMNAGITLRDISAQLTIDVCATWLQQFCELLQRQREHAQEW